MLLSKRITATVILIICSVATYAQGARGIDAAGSELATYFNPLGNLLMVVGGIVGLVGAIRVYIKWNSGDQDVQKALMGWIGSCIFLVVSGAVVKAFFGL